MAAETISTSTLSQKERKRRRRELVFACFCFTIIVLLSWLELKFLGVDSVLFVGLFNINFILLLLVLFIVARNGVKLLLERRRKVLGSKLRTRLVLAFISLSIIPTVLIFLVSIQFVQTSVDYWFKGQVEDSMQQALEVGRSFYGSAQDRLRHRGEFVIQEIKDRQFAWGGQTMDEYLGAKTTEYDLVLLGVVTPDGEPQNRHGGEAVWEQSWPEVRGKVDWEALKKTPAYWSTILPKPGNDLVVGLTPVDGGQTGYLLMVESIGQGLLYRLDQVVRGLEEYQKLKSLKYPWKMTLYLTLGVMTMLIVLGAIWFGFRLAKELSSPVQALAAGTERVARGDLDVHLEDQSDDELGFLVQSFNRMTRDLKESQQSLKAANDRLAQQNLELEQRGRYIEAVLNTITSGVISLDSEGRIGTVNKAAQMLLGAEARAVIGRKPLELLRGDFAELIREALGQLETSPSSQWQRQVDVPTRSGPMKLLVNVVSLRNDRGQPAGAVAVFEDITELEKMQRLAAWREVARRIAHEIKNPLTPIKLSAQRLQRKYGEALKAERTFQECTELIVRQVERLQQMVTEFSAYAKLPEIQLRPDFLAPLLEEVVGLFANTHRHIDWELDISGPIHEAPLDREAMRRVFINLLTNAAEAIEADAQTDGRVVVTAEPDEDRDWIHVSVADNGPGFSPQEERRLFEPYFSRKKSGTGLGLTIVKSIVNDHRGHVHVRANRPRGTVFRVDIPAA